jgi:hypothetical protein
MQETIYGRETVFDTRPCRWGAVLATGVQKCPAPLATSGTEVEMKRESRWIRVMIYQLNQQTIHTPGDTLASHVVEVLCTQRLYTIIEPSPLACCRNLALSSDELALLTLDNL